MSAHSSLFMTMMIMMMVEMPMRLKDVYDEGCCMMDGADGRGWQMMATFNVGQHFKYSHVHTAQILTDAPCTNTHMCTLHKYTEIQRHTCKIHTQTHNRAKPFKRYTNIHLKNCTARSFCKSCKLSSLFLAEYFLLSQSICRAPKVFALLPKYWQRGRSQPV